MFLILTVCSCGTMSVQFTASLTCIMISLEVATPLSST